MLASRVERKDRRRSLFREGVNLSATEPVPRKRSAPPSKTVLATMRAKARDVGIVPGATLSFAIQHPTSIKRMPKAMLARDTAPTAFHVLFGRAAPQAKAMSTDKKPGVVDIVALIGKEVSGKIVSFAKIYSR